MAILDTLPSATAQANFHTLLTTHPATAHLVQGEREWLWNYLQHSNELSNGGWGKPKADPSYVPDAATVGW